MHTKNQREAQGRTKKSKGQKRGRNPPSHAALRKDPTVRVEELEKEGKNKAAVAVIMSHEGYKRNELARALNQDPRKLDYIITGRDGRLKDALQQQTPADQPQTPAAQIPPLTDEQKKAAAEAQAEAKEQLEEAKEKLAEEKRRAEDLEALRLLPEISKLGGYFDLVAGVSPKKAGRIVDWVAQHQQQIDANPMSLYTAFQDFGLSNQRAQNTAATYFTDKGKPDTAKSLLEAIAVARGEIPASLLTNKGGPEGDNFDKMIDRISKVKSLGLIDQQIDSLKGGGGKNNEVEVLRQEMRERDRKEDLRRIMDEFKEEARKSDERHREEIRQLRDELVGRKRPEVEGDIFDKAEHAYVVKSVFKDGGGGQQLVEENIVEPVEDDEGNPVLDGKGVQKTRQHIIRHFAPTAQSAQGEPASGSTAWMDSMMKLLGMQIMTQALHPATNPGVATKQTVLRDDDGKIVLDQMKQPIILTEAMEVAGQPHSDPMEMLKFMSEQNLKIAELMMSKKSEEGPMEKALTTAMETVTKVSDAHTRYLEDQIAAFSDPVNNPVKAAADTIGQLKGLGLIGQPPTDNLAIAEMQNKLEEFKINKQDEWKKFEYEAKAKEQDKAFASSQMDRVTDVLKEGIEKVAGPLAVGFKDGYVTGARRVAAQLQPAQPAAGQQPQQQEPNGPINQEQIKAMANEELMAYLKNVDNADNVVNLTRQFVVAELGARGLRV